MTHRSTLEALLDLEAHGQLVRVPQPVDPHLEMAAIARRVYSAGGPAVLFERVHGTTFPACCNLYGSLERCRFLFRETLARTERLVEARADPAALVRAPWRHVELALAARFALPLEVAHGPGLGHATRVAELPAIVAWPGDGGPFATLPQVYTEDPDAPGPLRSNLGMYRVQLGGNEYEANREVGLHYQIHRGIGVHHAAALRRGEPLRVSIFVGGPPAHAVAAVMPLPEGLSELAFAGVLAGRRFRWVRRNGHVVAADADFTIVGRVWPAQEKPEGPFGDHLGYYSLRHPFPVLTVEAVYHRPNAVWPFTVVGRPPQEDTVFGRLIHEITRPMVPASLPGLRALHAVDAAGVHPLMLAIGSERYVPWGPRRPQELLTCASAVLGFGQASLAKYLFIAADGDDPGLRIDDVAGFLQHVLARFEPTRDLHFHTRTTIDTLDYSGTGLNAGSKLVWAAAGAAVRRLAGAVPADVRLPPGFAGPKLVFPGVCAVAGPRWEDRGAAEAAAAELAGALAKVPEFGEGGGLPLVVLCDDPDFVARSLRDFLWVTFTRSDPAADVTGVGSFVEHKHWGCRGAVIIDARSKPHHAPPLEEDPVVERRVDALAARGGPLHGIY